MPAEDHRALLQQALLKIRTLRAEADSLRRSRNEPIAIVGAGCRFPGGADSPDAFWRLLRDGVDAIREVPSGRWDVDAYYDPDPDAPGKMYTRNGGFLEDVETFDAGFFGISPREALRLDPQQRILLETAWHALEHAAIRPDRLSGSSTGVFVGVMGADYSFRQAQNLQAREIDPYMLSGGDLSFTAGRLAYQLGLQGPVMSVATACSSSLVAIHLAAQSLRAGECDLALAGGVSLILDPVVGIMLSQLRALSPNGRSKSFDASADGYGRGEGCGVLLLERLSDALANNRRILAVVRGSAVNHDGPSAGLTVPNGPAQEKLLRKAFAAAGVEPGQIGYVETHGTGTILGDPIEAQALARVMGDRERPLIIGSVKSAIGHLESAAGVAGVLKAALALRHRAIPPNLHFHTPNPHIPWDRIPLRVATELTEWPSDGTRIAGVSSFGLGGVNAHVVLEEAPRPEAANGSESGACILALSAKTPAALESLKRSYCEFLSAAPGARWSNICFTANRGRAHMEERFYLIAGSAAEAVRQLQGESSQNSGDGRNALRDIGEAFLRGGELASPESGQYVQLPLYPFQRQRYWVLRNGELPAGETPRTSGSAEIDELPLLEALRRKATETLGLTEPVDPERCLLDYGLDSLMAGELQDWLSAGKGLHADLKLLLSNRKLADIVLSLRPKPQLDSAPPPAPMPEVYPLSEGQKALWFIYQSDPASCAYNVGVALKVRAAVDVAAARNAFQALVDRHPTLRAVFSAPEGEPVQEIRPRVSVCFEQIEAAGWSDAELSDRAAAANRRPFDLGEGPVFRVNLFTRAEHDHVLLISMHHIVCDALSYWTLLDEFQTLYQGRPLPPPSATYAGYVQWQREMLGSAEGEELLEFWRRQLGGDLPVLALPLDKPRPAVLRFEGGSHSVRVPAALAAKLRELGRAHGATLHQTLLAAYFALLHRYTGQDEAIVGTATAGRPTEFAGVVGYFTNPVPIRADLSGDPPFSELLERVLCTTFEAIAHQQMPFAYLVKQLQPKRDPSRQPVFQADYALLKRPPAYRHGHLGALPLEPLEMAGEEGQFDLSLHVTEDDVELNAAFKYNSSLFEHSTIRGMAECFLTLLAGLAADPSQRIGALPLLEESERRCLLATGRGSDVTYAPEPVHRIFELQAARAPDAIAAEEYGSGKAWSYRELNRRANRVAARLRSLGLQPDSLAGICIERSLELAAAALGTLKASAGYVPLDPSYPAERLAFMMRDSGVAAVLTTSALGPRLAVSDGIPVIHLDEWDSLPEAGDENPPCVAGPENLAYAIYTSGSTGVPKGAVITHGGLSNYLQWAVDAYRAGVGCGAPVSSAFGFDATVTSFFAPLISGGKIVLLPESDLLESLAGCLRTNRGFSLVKITPAHLEALSQLLAPEDCAGRARVFVIGGEALRGEALQFWQEHAPDTRLINEYGPTETVVGCCVFEAREGSSGSVPIGRPIANTQLYVLDGRMQPVPRGVVGELCIGGAGVCRGYLNRPEVTRARFVPDPFSSEPGARLFRTGDLARILPDGTFDFLGRSDHQVKIKGYRIELGEIEATLAGHPRVTASVVVVHQGRLAAYVTPATAPSAAELRSYLAERLPEYMVPAFFLALPAFPLTANGKVDRKALPAPEAPRAASRFVAPRDPLELKIAAIWEETLGIRPAGVKDNFFDVGGHSLLAVRLMTRLQREFGRKIPLASLLRGPTVERLANLLRDAAPALNSALVPIHAAGGKAPFYCVPGAGGNVIYLYSLARRLGPDQPFYGLQAAGFDGEAPPQTTVEEMAAQYVAAIEAVQPHGPYLLGGHSLGGWVAYEMAQILLRKGREVPLVAVIDTPIPAPGRGRDTSDWDSARWIVELADRIGHLLNPDLQVSIEALRSLDPEAQLEYFKSALLRADLFPGDAGNDHLRNVLRLFKAHSQIRYHLPPNPLPVRIALLRTASAPPDSPFCDDAWGWSSVAETEVYLVPGEHLTALRPPHVLTLADRLARCLDQAQRASAEKGKTACPQA